MRQTDDGLLCAWDEIIERARALDLDALDRIVDEYCPRLMGFFRRLLGSRADAEDLVQEVFVRVIRKIADYEHRGRFDAWLFSIASNIGRDHIRRAGRSAELMEASAAADASTSTERDGDLRRAHARSPADQAELEDEKDRLQDALACLPLVERQVILLRHYGALSFAEIAEQMGTPLGTALARAHRGLGRLRAFMETTR